MSHLGSRILYGLLNDQKGIWMRTRLRAMDRHGG